MTPTMYACCAYHVKKILFSDVKSALPGACAMMGHPLTMPLLIMLQNNRQQHVCSAILLLLLVVLAVRLTVQESFRAPLGQRIATADMIARGTAASSLPPDVGPSFIVGCFFVTLVLAVAAALCGLVGRRHLAWLVLLLVIGALVSTSALRAANVYFAVVGTCDFLTALLAGWIVAVAATSSLHRRLIVSALFAIAAAWVFRGMMQWLIELPEMHAMYRQNAEEMLRSQNIQPGTPEATLFERRLLGGEVGGYLAMVNVAAAGLVGLVSVAVGTLLAFLRFRAPETEKQKKGHTTEGREIPLVGVTAGVLVLIAGGAMLMTWLTQSNGGIAALLASLLAIGIGVFAWQRVVRLRTPLVVAILVGFVLGLGAVAYYGITHDRLPSKTLTFRWHYWTGAAEITRDHLLHGVGLNNFGDYYLAYKRPSAPEDVKDPHNMLVRLAAETGLPAVILIAGLALFVLIWSLKRRNDERTPADFPWLRVAMIALGFVTAWLVARFLIAETRETYFILMTVILIAPLAGVFLAAWHVTGHLTIQGLRVLSLAALAGAAGMLLYDQINTALVTGPVAMLFWVLLGLAASGTPVVHPSRKLNILATILLVVSAIRLVTVTYTGHSLSPAPHETQFIEHLIRGNYQEAMRTLDAAIARAPRSTELLRWRIRLQHQLKRSAEEDIRKFITLDRANAGPRIDFYREHPGLPVELRVQLLEEALRFDAALADDEPKRLKASQRAELQQQLQSLRPTTSP